ncbi:hypothetical protein ACWGET_20365 [Streptomyces zaomyceticus]
MVSSQYAAFAYRSTVAQLFSRFPAPFLVALRIEREACDHGRDAPVEGVEVSVQVTGLRRLDTGNLHHVTTGQVNGDAPEQATRRDDDQPLFTDLSEVRRLAQWPVLVSDQPAWDAGLPETDGNLGVHLVWRLDGDQDELRLW